MVRPPLSCIAFGKRARLFIQFLYLVDGSLGLLILIWHSVAGIALPPVYANYPFH